jgi:hypothetical protein
MPVLAKMRKDKKIIWVIMHYEIMGLPDSPYVDSVQFHVSSSLKKAENYICSRGVQSHSWWQVHPHILDAGGNDASVEGDEVYYFSYRGTPLKSAPINRAITAFRRHAARYPEIYSSPVPCHHSNFYLDPVFGDTGLTSFTTCV